MVILFSSWGARNIAPFTFFLPGHCPNLKVSVGTKISGEDLGAAHYRDKAVNSSIIFG